MVRAGHDTFQIYGGFCTSRGTIPRVTGTMPSWCAPDTRADGTPAWMGYPITTSWRAPQKATNVPFGRCRNGMRGQHSGSRGASLGTRRRPRTSCRMRSCASGSTRRGGVPRPQSAPGFIVSWSISASTRGGVRPTCRSRLLAMLDPNSAADEQLRLRERDHHLAAAIDALPPRQRAAVVLTYQEGLSNAEVAEVLDTSVSGVETLLVRARRTLRAAFESDQS